MTTTSARTTAATCRTCGQALTPTTNAVTGVVQLVADDGWGTVCGNAPAGEHVPAATALVIAVDGTVTPEQLPDGDHLAFLQARVEGDIECVSLSPDIDMWVNDEGLFTHEMNPVATLIAHTFGMDAQGYHGPAVFTGGVDDEGNTLPLTSEWVSVLQLAAEHLATRLA